MEFTVIVLTILIIITLAIPTKNNEDVDSLNVSEKTSNPNDMLIKKWLDLTKENDIEFHPMSKYESIHESTAESESIHESDSAVDSESDVTERPTLFEVSYGEKTDFPCNIYRIPDGNDPCCIRQEHLILHTPNRNFLSDPNGDNMLPQPSNLFSNNLVKTDEVGYFEKYQMMIYERRLENLNKKSLKLNHKLNDIWPNDPYNGPKIDLDEEIKYTQKDLCVIYSNKSGEDTSYLNDFKLNLESLNNSVGIDEAGCFTKHQIMIYEERLEILNKEGKETSDGLLKMDLGKEIKHIQRNLCAIYNDESGEGTSDLNNIMLDPESFNNNIGVWDYINLHIGDYISLVPFIYYIFMLFLLITSIWPIIKLYLQHIIFKIKRKYKRK